MGTLLIKDQIKNPEWYFSDTWYNFSGNRYMYDWPSTDYPTRVGIHNDHLKQNSNRIRIRKWIEHNLQETVIFDEIDNSYHKYYAKPFTWDNKYDVENRWGAFYFSDPESALAFSLAFSDIVSEITKHHPSNPADKAWLDATHEERLSL